MWLTNYADKQQTMQINSKAESAHCVQNSQSFAITAKIRLLEFKELPIPAVFATVRNVIASTNTTSVQTVVFAQVVFPY